MQAENFRCSVEHLLHYSDSDHVIIDPKASGFKLALLECLKEIRVCAGSEDRDKGIVYLRIGHMISRGSSLVSGLKLAGYGFNCPIIYPGLSCTSFTQLTCPCKGPFYYAHGLGSSPLALQGSTAAVLAEYKLGLRKRKSYCKIRN